MINVIGTLREKQLILTGELEKASWRKRHLSWVLKDEQDFHRWESVGAGPSRRSDFDISTEVISGDNESSSQSRFCPFSYGSHHPCGRC